MGYYKGDFYGRGGYYQGDPGFLGSVGSFFSHVYHDIKDVAIPAVLGGINPALGAAARGVIAARNVVTAHPVVSAAAAAATLGAGGLAAARMHHPGLMGGAGGAAGLRGYHMSKPRRGVPSHPVKNRHMHVTNPRALHRAIRRARGFEKLARRVIGFSSPHKPKGRIYFKKRRRK